jgi:hypothetical protein
LLFGCDGSEMDRTIAMNKGEIIGIDLVLLIVVGIMIWARWKGHRPRERTFIKTGESGSLVS